MQLNRITAGGLPPAVTQRFFVKIAIFCFFAYFQSYLKERAKIQKPFERIKLQVQDLFKRLWLNGEKLKPP